MGHCNLCKGVTHKHRALSLKKLKSCCREQPICCRVSLEKQVENWSDKNLTKFNKGKLALYLGRNNPITAQSVSKLARKDLGFLVHSKLNMSQQRVLAAQKPSDLVDCISNTLARMWKSDYSPLLSIFESVSEVPRPVQGFQPWKRLDAQEQA